MKKENFITIENNKLKVIEIKKQEEKNFDKNTPKNINDIREMNSINDLIVSDNILFKKINFELPHSDCFILIEIHENKALQLLLEDQTEKKIYKSDKISLKLIEHTFSKIENLNLVNDNRITKERILYYITTYGKLVFAIKDKSSLSMRLCLESSSNSVFVEFEFTLSKSKSLNYFNNLIEDALDNYLDFKYPSFVNAFKENDNNFSSYISSLVKKEFDKLKERSDFFEVQGRNNIKENNKENSFVNLEFGNQNDIYPNIKENKVNFFPITNMTSSKIKSEKNLFNFSNTKNLNFQENKNLNLQETENQENQEIQEIQTSNSNLLTFKNKIQDSIVSNKNNNLNDNQQNKKNSQIAQKTNITNTPNYGLEKSNFLDVLSNEIETLNQGLINLKIDVEYIIKNEIKDSIEKDFFKEARKDIESKQIEFTKKCEEKFSTWQQNAKFDFNSKIIKLDKKIDDLVSNIKKLENSNKEIHNEIIQIKEGLDHKNIQKNEKNGKFLIQIH